MSAVVPGRGRRMRAVSVLLPLAGLLLAGLWAWLDVTAQSRATVIRDMTLLRAEVLRTLEVQESVLVAVNLATAGLSWPEIRASHPVHDMLVQLADFADAVDTLGFVDPEGRIAASNDTPASAPTIDLSGRDFVTAFPRGAQARYGYVSEIMTSRIDGRPLAYLARPRLERADAADNRGDGGVVFAGFYPRLFQHLFADVARGRISAMVLLREDGNVLARFPDPVESGTPHRLAVDDPVLRAARALPRGDALAVYRGGLSAVQRLGHYGLLLSLVVDSSVVRIAWLRQMIFPTAGAVAMVALLLLLARRTEARLLAEEERMRLRTVQIEAEKTAAQERARLETELRQTERQAAIGQLAAGIAHDFGNLLQTVMVGADALHSPALTADRVRGYADLILRAAERGVSLTRRMLDFARLEEDEGALPGAERFSPEDALRGAQELLSHLLGRRWPVTLALPPTRLPPAHGNLAQCESVLINLAVNARDAMPNGGAIVLHAELAEAPAALAGASSGAFVCISVRDGGHGMDSATLARAGEAFFTTKPRGEGTGLGLSMARGFAQRAGGMLEVASVPEQGTTVTLWLATG